MTKVKKLQLDDGNSVFVEVEDIEVEDIDKLYGVDDRGLGKSISTKDDVLLGMKLFQENIKTMAENVHQSFLESQPDEWSIEMDVKFAGKTHIIPFITSGEGSAGIKVKATWKKKA